MTYDFKSQGGAISVYPNPFKIENKFLFAGGSVLFAGGLACLLSAKDMLAAGQMVPGAAAGVASLFLFSAGSKMLIDGFSQLRFWMGLHYPVGLAGAPDIQNKGTGEGSEAVVEMLRQQTISFPEPKGPINGILYSLMQKLIVAPPRLQMNVQARFESLLNSLVIFASLLFSWALYSGTEFEGAISWMYLPLSGLTLFQILRNRIYTRHQPTDGKVIAQAAAIAVLAFLLPIGAPFVSANIGALGGIPLMWQASVVALTSTIATSFLFLLSASHQIDAAEETAVSCSVETISMNCHPSQIWAELDRKMQEGWTQEIPNRKYIAVEPKTGIAERGSFSGSILEETQPEPKDRMTFSSISDALSLPHGRYLVGMSAFGLLMTLITACVAAYYSINFAAMDKSHIMRAAMTIFALGTSSLAAMSGGHLLWTRLHFKSRITWIELIGGFQKSTIDVGNTVRDKFRTTSTLTRIENATLRVWSADIESVAFDKDGRRYVVGMRPAESHTTTISNSLIEFAQAQTSITQPTSAGDQDRITQIANLGHALNAPIATIPRGTQAAS